MIITANKSNWTGQTRTFKVNKTEKSITFNGEKFFVRCHSKNTFEVHNMNHGTIAYVYKEKDMFFVENTRQNINRENSCMWTAIYQLLNNII